MAVFNPQVPDTQDPNYLGYSKGIEQPKPNTTLGEVFKGIGDTLKAGVAGVDTVIKNNIDDQLRAAIEPQQKGFITALENIRNGMGKGVSSLFGSSDTADMPHEVQTFGDRMDNLHESYISGKFTPLEYRKNLFTMIKDIRANNPGYLDYIDQKSSSITGFNIANAYMSSLLSDANASESAAKSVMNKQNDFVKTNLGDIGPGLVKQWQSASGPDREKLFNQIELKVADRKSQESDVKLLDAQLKSLQIDDQTKGIKANRYLDIRIPQLVNNTLEDTMDNAGQSFKKIQDKITAHLNGTTRMDSTAIQDLGSQLAAIRPLIVKNAYNEALSKGAVAALGSEVVNKKIEAGLASTFDPIVKAAGTGDATAANYWTRLSKAIQDKDKLSVLLDDDMGPIVRTHEALQSIFSNSAIYQKWIDREIQEDPKMPEKLTHFKIGVKSRAVVPASYYDEDHPKPTMTDDLNKLPAAGISKTGENSHLLGKATSAIIGTVDMIKRNDIPDAGAEGVVEWAFNPQTYGVLDRFDLEYVNPKTGRMQPGAIAVWDKVTNKDVASKIYKLNPQSGEAYTNWVLEGFGNSIFRRYMNQLRDFPDAEKLQFSYNNVDKRLKVELASGTKVIADNPPGMPLPKDSITEAQQAKINFNVDQFNRGLSGLKNVQEASGGRFNFDAYVLNLLGPNGMKINLSDKKDAAARFGAAVVTAGSKPPEEQPAIKAPQSPTNDRTGVKKENTMDSIPHFAQPTRDRTITDFLANPAGDSIPMGRRNGPGERDMPPAMDLTGRKMAPGQNLTDSANTITGIDYGPVERAR